MINVTKDQCVRDNNPQQKKQRVIIKIESARGQQ